MYSGICQQKNRHIFEDLPQFPGDLSALLPYRKDKGRLRELMEENPVYRSMDKETARTVSVLMGIKKHGEREGRYRTAL